MGGKASPKKSAAANTTFPVAWFFKLFEFFTFTDASFTVGNPSYNSHCKKTGRVNRLTRPAVN
jgi:hypothetical protein